LLILLIGNFRPNRVRNTLGITMKVTVRLRMVALLWAAVVAGFVRSSAPDGGDFSVEQSNTAEVYDGDFQFSVGDLCIFMKI
jgi:hypothetical protein